jgi:hypothetical protein
VTAGPNIVDDADEDAAERLMGGRAGGGESVRR